MNRIDPAVRVAEKARVKGHRVVGDGMVSRRKSDVSVRRPVWRGESGRSPSPHSSEESSVMELE